MLPQHNLLKTKQEQVWPEKEYNPETGKKNKNPALNQTTTATNHTVDPAKGEIF